MANQRKRIGPSFQGSDDWNSSRVEATWVSTDVLPESYEVVVVRFEERGSFALALVVSEQGPAPQFEAEDLEGLLTGPAHAVDDEEIALAAVTLLREKRRVQATTPQPPRLPGQCACGRAAVVVDIVDFHLSQLSRVLSGEEPVALMGHRRDVEAARTALIGASVSLASPEFATFIYRTHYDVELWKLSTKEIMSRVGGTETDREILRCLRAWIRRLNDIDAVLQETGQGKTLGPTAVEKLYEGRPTIWFPHVESCPMSVLSETTWKSVNAPGGAA